LHGACDNPLLTGHSSLWNGWSNLAQDKIIKIDDRARFIRSQAVAEVSKAKRGSVKVTVEISIEVSKFTRVTDFDASRPITKGEMDTCKQAALNILNCPWLAWYRGDGQSNNWVTSMTTDLKKIWEPAAQAKSEMEPVNLA
jgi:hypothetical protein